MGLLNDIYDSADQAMRAKEEKQRKESNAKALAKQKAKGAAGKQTSGLF